MPDAEAPIVVEETYPVDAATVWKAITDPQQMPKWFFEQIETFEPRVGFETRFSVHAEGQDYVHVWKVTDAIENERVAYTYNFDGFDGDALVVWQLSPADGGTRVSVTHTGLHTFPKDLSVFAREACEGGWKYFLKEQLKAFLTKGT